MTASPNRAQAADASALASAGLADCHDAYRLDFHSIGSASPGNAAAIAVGLGVPVTVAMEALYRAPSVLVDGLTEAAGAQMRDLLQELGCSVTLGPQDAPAPPPTELYDVALHITSTARYAEITHALAAFLGTQPDDAGRLVSTPPGVILGKVSQATVDALCDRLGEGVSVVASDPEAAFYDVFLGSCDASVKARLLADLRRRKLEPLTESGCILAGLTKCEAESLWSVHQRVRELRVVNRDFLRFDLVLTGGTATVEATRALIDVAGIPARIVPKLFDQGEITVMDAVPHAEMIVALEHLSCAGLAVRADLVSFLHLGLEITDAPRPRAVSDALSSIGMEVSEHDLRRLPCRLPWYMPELQARMLRDTLEACGAQAQFIDVNEPGGAS